jgi:hypothetical protein
MFVGEAYSLAKYTLDLALRNKSLSQWEYDKQLAELEGRELKIEPRVVEGPSRVNSGAAVQAPMPAGMERWIPQGLPPATAYYGPSNMLFCATASHLPGYIVTTQAPSPSNRYNEIISIGRRYITDEQRMHAFECAAREHEQERLRRESEAKAAAVKEQFVG